MDYDKEYLKQQLSLQGITVKEEDLHYVQRVLSIIKEGEKHLEDFSRSWKPKNYADDGYGGIEQ